MNEFLGAIRTANVILVVIAATDCKQIPSGLTVEEFLVDTSANLPAFNSLQLSARGNAFVPTHGPFGEKVPMALSDQQIFYHPLNREISGDIYISVSKGVDLYSVDAKVLLTVGVEQETEPSAWLLSDARLSQLVLGNNGSAVLFPDLRAVWDDVANQSPDKAVTYLQGRIDTKTAITLFGLNVDQRVVMFVGPVSIFIAAFYLLLVIKMLLIGIEKSPLETTHLKLYPWFGIFGDRVSLTATLISTVILPPAASIILVREYSSGADVFSVVAIIATLAIV